MGLTLRLSLLKMKIHLFCLATMFVIVGQVAAFGQDNNAEPKEDQVIAVDVEPKVLNLDSVKRQLIYPIELREKGVQGKVITRLLVNEKGRVVKHVIKETPHKALTESVEILLYNLSFSPAIKDGKPVKYWVTVPFKFVLG